MRRFLSFLYRLFHPLRRPLGPIPLGTVTLLAVVFVLGLTLGWFGRARYDAAYFRSHYRFPGLVVPQTQRAMPVRPRALPPTGGVRLDLYPAVGDQGQLGACAAWASAWDASYEWRVAHPGSSLRFSPRQLYDHYADTYANGQDAGSWPDQDLEIASTTGLLQFKAFPEPPYQIDDPLPVTDTWGHVTATDAAKHRFSYVITDIGGTNTGQGQGLVDGIKAAIAAGHPVMLGFPVWPEYDNATNEPLIVSPTPAEVQAQPFGRGGHENVALAWNDTLVFPDGTIGGILVQNQWATQWGNQGRAWLSYDFVRRWVFGAESLQIGPSIRAGTKPIPWVPNHAPAHPAPPSPPTSRATGSAWYVHGVITRDTHVDISSLLNYWGNYYGVSPLGLAATTGVESGVNQYADRCCTPGDTSYGIAQETTGTTCGYVGICSNDAVRAYLDNPANAIALAARYYRDALSYHAGRIGFPLAYEMYNAGFGYSDAYYYAPSSDVAAHEAVYLGWYNYALAHWAGGSPPAPPKPTPFPAKSWGPLSHSYRGHLSWCASVWLGHQHLGRYEGQRWTQRRHGFTTCRFSHGQILTWPAYHTAKVIRP